MTWYAVYEIATGALKGQGSQVPSDVELAARGLAKKTYASKPDRTWNPETLALDIDIDIPQSRIAVGVFLDRFTLDEHGAAVDLARTNGMAKAWYDRVKLMTSIDATDTTIVMGMGFLQAEGILTPERAAKIMDW